MKLRDIWEPGSIHLFGTALVFVGAAIFVACREWQTYQSLSWPSTQGVVTGHSAFETPGHKPGHNPPNFHSLVNYSYGVSGQPLTSDRVAFNIPWQFKSDSREGAVLRGLTEYPLGSPVTVFYDPDEPTEAILIKRPPDWSFVKCFGTLGGLALVFAIIVVVREEYVNKHR